jgi:hypothetical protein
VAENREKTLKNIGGNRGIAPGQARLRTFQAEDFPSLEQSGRLSGTIVTVDFHAAINRCIQ